jgi:hypothetical protein
MLLRSEQIEERSWPGEGLVLLCGAAAHLSARLDNRGE